MTDTYNDTTGSRKKFLIPLVVLLLCAVSLTGAGYAYNTTVQTAPADVDGNVFVVNTYTNDGQTVKLDPYDETNNVIIFTSDTTYTSSTAGTADIKANAASADPVLLGSAYFKVTSDEVATAYVTFAGDLVDTAVTNANLTDAQVDAVKALKNDIELTYVVKTTGNSPQTVNGTGNGDWAVTVGTLYKVEMYAEYIAAQPAVVGDDIQVSDGQESRPVPVETVVGYFESAFDLFDYYIKIVADNTALPPAQQP